MSETRVSPCQLHQALCECADALVDIIDREDMSREAIHEVAMSALARSYLIIHPEEIPKETH